MTQHGKNAFPTASFPKDHLVAIIDSMDEATQAVQALQQEGYNADALYLYSSQDFIRLFESSQQQESGFAKWLHTAQGSSDEGFAGNMYLDEAHRGNNVLAVHEPKEKQTQHVCDVLKKYHSHLIKYFGTWAVTDLSYTYTMLTRANESL